MCIEQLEYIVNLKETLSITKTANNFFISHQALSSSINSLEKELGVILFNRSNQGIQFTNVGEMIYDFSKEVLQKYNHLLSDISPYKKNENNSSLTGKLFIYAIPRYLSSVFWNFMNFYQNINPNLDILIKSCYAEKAINAIKDNPCAVALVTFNSAKEKTFNNLVYEKKLNYHIIKKEPLAVCVNKKSELASYPILDNNTLKQFKLTAFDYFDELFEESTINFNINYYVDNFEQQKKLLTNPSVYTICSFEEYKLFGEKNHIYIPLREKLFNSYAYLYCDNPSNQTKDFLNCFLNKFNR